MGVTVPSGWFQVTSGLSLRQDEFDERKHVSSGGPTNRCDCGKFRGRLRSQVGMEWHLRVVAFAIASSGRYGTGMRFKIARIVFAVATAVLLPCWFYTGALINSYVYRPR
jgi:hypothetical protein